LYHACHNHTHLRKKYRHYMRQHRLAHKRQHRLAHTRRACSSVAAPRTWYSLLSGSLAPLCVWGGGCQGGRKGCWKLDWQESLKVALLLGRVKRTLSRGGLECVGGGEAEASMVAFASSEASANRGSWVSLDSGCGNAALSPLPRSAALVAASLGSSQGPRSARGNGTE
jgi:hypothetical protein